MRTVDEIKAQFENDAKNGFSNENIRLRGALLGHLNKACGGDANRKLLLKFLTGKTSSKDLTNGEWAAVYAFVDAKPFGAEWLARNELERDCKLILEKMADQEGQIRMLE